MASVFLSYDHDDAARARTIALALENAGHSVWWDLHVRGGAQYSKVIEEALNASDAVVVLWSSRSVESAWVRDEAATGRDSGRLVPVGLDGTPPPLGFRQYQTIDLSRWNARIKGAQFQELLRAIDGITDEALPSTAAVPVARQAWRPASRPIMIGALAIIGALILAALVIWQPWSPKSAAPTVTVTASGNSEATRALTNDLLIKLGSLQSARADLLQLVDPQSGTITDFTLRVGMLASPGDPRANIALIDRGGTLLWSREFVQPGGNEADLRQQIAYSSGQVLRCATDALAPAHPKLELPTLKLYLNGCADFSEQVATDARLLIPPFRNVTERAPKFAGGWGKLLMSEVLAYRQSNFTDAALRRDLQKHLAQARKLHPNIAEPALAEGWLQTPRPIQGWMRFADEAAVKDPHNAGVLMNRTTGLLHVGRIQEAVEDAKRAVRAEPLYPAARAALIDTLGHAGAISEAKKELREAERLWPGASDLHLVRFSLEYRYGDPKEALRMLQAEMPGLSSTPVRLSFLEARIDPSRLNIERAIAVARHEYRMEPYAMNYYLHALSQFGRTEEAANALLVSDAKSMPGIIFTFFRPYHHALRQSPKFMAIAKRFGLIAYWRETGKWPDFCSEPGLPYDCKAEAAKLAG